MGEASAEITIDRPADEVWAKLGNFGDLLWMPGIETSSSTATTASSACSVCASSSGSSSVTTRRARSPTASSKAT